MSYRAEIGAWVKRRLLHKPNVFQVPATDLDIFVARAFLDSAECKGLIELIDRNRRPSKVLADNPDPLYRTSESCDLDPRHPLVATIEDKITALMGIQPELGEAIQGQRYAVGQEFKPHHDFFYVDQPYWPAQQRSGGQRTWTAMVFLNEPEAGGQTAFVKADLRITPRAGNLLTWNNLDALGEPNLQSLHQGMPVEAGLKYVITKWYREQPWGERTAS